MHNAQIVIVQRLSVIAITAASVILLWRAGVIVPGLPQAPDSPTGDAQNYLAAALSFSQSGQLLNASGEAFTLFPPGLPIAFGALLTLGFAPSMALFALNAMSVVAFLACTYLTAVRVLGSPWLGLATIALVGLNPSFLQVNQQLWTEPIFGALVAAFFFVVVTIIREPRYPRGWWIAAFALVWLMTWLKFLGIVFAAVLALVYLMNVRRTWVARLRNAIGVLLIGLAGLVPVVARNISLGVGAFGNRNDPYVSWEGAISSGLQTFGRIIVQPESSGLSGVIGIVVATIVLFGTWFAWLRRVKSVQILGSGIIIYWVALWVSQVRTHVDVEVERFFVPMLGITVIVLLYALVQWWFATKGVMLARYPAVVSRLTGFALIALLVLVIVLNALKTYLVATQSLV